jgi:tetratricopeptide (TPR) repeat protein
MKTKIKLLLLVISALLIFGNISLFPAPYNPSRTKTYEQIDLSADDSISAVDVFEQVWQILNANYPYFEQRGIDWQAMYKVYRPKISPGTSSDELYQTLCSMLEHFNDGHINLETGEKRFCSYTVTNNKMVDFSWKLVRDKYLNRAFKASPDSLFYYGWLTPELAYMRIRRFPNKEILERYIDTIISEIAGAESLIIDVRGNPGGNGFGVAALGSRFADTKRLYSKNMNRIDQEKNYTSPTYHYVEPLGPVQYRRPVILLQNRYSESGSDLFALALRVLPNAISIGEHTGGCFATYYPEKLINGWTLTMPFSYVVDQNDFCWEGMGIPPNIRKANTKEDIEAGNDKVLEFAIDLYKAGGNTRKEADGSLNDLRISLVDKFVEMSAEKDIQSAVALFKKLQKDNPDGVYFSVQEYGLAINNLNRSKKIEELLALLELGQNDFPDNINSLYYLAKIYENVKEQPEKAKLIYEKIAGLKPTFPWEEPLVAEAKRALTEMK